MRVPVELKTIELTTNDLLKSECIFPAIQNKYGEFYQKKLEALFTIAPFSSKSIVMSLFISQKTISITFFTDHCTQNFFFGGESVFPLHKLFVNSGSL